jgi:7-keto-8-aminopelargonate synthetase-like enzyme
MAKTRHNHFIDTINRSIEIGSEQGVLNVQMEGDFFEGRHIQFGDRSLFHFGTTSYMGLEQDLRLKRAAVEAIMKYGTQFPLSKTYVRHSLNDELTEKIGAMVKGQVLIGKNSTLTHLGVIPSIVRDEDMVILDQQVHFSVQSACVHLKVRGVPVELIKHSDLNQLEEWIKKSQNKYKKCWYMVDGVYSMFGDVAPLPELKKLLDKYDNFYLYIDDVHGMSWAGENGAGYAYSVYGELHEKMVMVSTLSKSFGASGAFMTSKNKKIVDEINIYGGVMTFSAQLEPAGLGAAIASANIHLSDEIYDLQNELAEKVEYCNSLIDQTDLPRLVRNNCPLFYIGTGLPSSAFNLSKRLNQDGFYVNVSIFPAVPIKNTGIRFSVCRHNQKEDIKGLIEAMVYHYPLMLEDEHKSNNDIRKLFKMPLLETTEPEVSIKDDLIFGYYSSIQEIDKDIWNTLVAKDQAMDASVLSDLEKGYKSNDQLGGQMEMIYPYVKDQAGNYLFLTFCTIGDLKEDMLAESYKSKYIENVRLTNPEFLVSKGLMMGSLINEGHMYYLAPNKNSSKIIKVFLDGLQKVQSNFHAQFIFLRDFDKKDVDIIKAIESNGYAKIDLPDINTVKGLRKYTSVENWISDLSYKNRYHVRSEILSNEKFFKVHYLSKLNESELKEFYTLYQNVRKNNLDINTFDVPLAYFKEANTNDSIEFIKIELNDESCDIKEKAVAYVICYKHPDAYTPMLMGMDYTYLKQYSIYRFSLFQMLKRAMDLGCDSVYLGFSAAIEKRKLGAETSLKVGFVQYNDNFSLEYMENIAVVQ